MVPATSTSTSNSTISNTVRVIVTKNVPAEHQEEWLTHARELATETWKEEGCLSYNYVKNPDKKERFVIVEEWESQAHLDAHFETPHFTRLVPLMDGMSHTADIDVCRNALPISRNDNDNDNDKSDRRHRNGRILVLYDTATGSTEHMAVLIAEGVQLLDRMDVRIRVVPGQHTSWEDASTVIRDATHPFATYDDIYWADGVAAGSPTNLGCISYRMKQFWDDFSQAGGWSNVDGKIGTAFTSQGGHGGGGELVNMAMQTVLMNCGFSVFGITDYVGFKDTMHYGAAVAKKPRDELDKMKCRRQGLRLAEFVAFYINGRDEANPMHSKKSDTSHWGFPGIPPREADPQELKSRNTSLHCSLLPRSPLPLEKQKQTKKKKALIFTKMNDYVHDSTPAMAAWVSKKLHELFGWEGVISDNADLLESPSKIAMFDTIIFLNNSGNIFKDETETHALLHHHIAAGKGVLGVHAALAAFLNGTDASGETIMEPTCDIMESIFGAHFQNHPPVQTGTVHMAHHDNKNNNKNNNNNKLAPWLVTLPAQFTHTDEFFNFNKNVSNDPDITVIAWADETTYQGGRMGERHPLAWYREMGEAKAPIFYSALGHFSHFYNGMMDEEPSSSSSSSSHAVTTILEAGLHFCCKM